MEELITYNYGAGKTVRVQYPKLCPRCHVAIKPEQLFAMSYGDEKRGRRAAILYKCTNCGEPFIVIYDTNQFLVPINELEVAPRCAVIRSFSKIINDLSPKFCEIYRQASVAEREGLNEVSGIGYRKSLEFLIKDYSIKRKTDDAERIKKLSLSQCIDKYIDDNDINTLAKRAVWMGNDETHFLKLYGDYNTQEKIKKFIDAIVYFIEKKVVVEEAEKIEARK